ncbi:MAG: Agmatine deiminase [Planctomycetota bacterium]|jgi:agmatine deiminase
MLPLHHYRWPAEWESHAATWTAWPVNPNTWPGIFERIPPAFAEFAAAIAEFEPLRILAGGTGVRESAQPLLDAACSRRGARFTPEWFNIPVNDSWCRDHGPIFLTGRSNSPANGTKIILDWNYNAWGGKYPPWDLDELTARRIAQTLNLRSIRPRLILEGGAIEGNGEGTILTTDSCLLNPNRNPGMTREVMNEVLAVWLQAEHVVWLPGHGVVGDDTDGHIDQTARFTSHRHVLVAAPWNHDAPEAPALRANFDAVATARNSRGLSLLPQPLPLPPPKFLDDNRLPASYCNYILVNGGLIVPTFRDPADDVAMQILQTAHPDRRIVGVDALDLAWGLGAFHCMTQQEPAAVHCPQIPTN